MKNLMKALLIAVMVSVPAKAQLPVSLELPRVSPLETRSITIGFTEIGFEYSSVAVRDREIWGGLVPYGEIWRTGANKNTVFMVSDDVLINGEALPAGEYGFHTIPGEDSWTLIFSNFSDAWGSFFYDESEDALRVEVTPEEMNSTYEWMKFSFGNYTDTSVDMSLKWAGLKVPFTVTVPREVTFAHIEKQFRTLPAFSWQGWFQGAQYTLNNEYEMQTGLEWIDRAIEQERSPQTLSVKGRLLVKSGDTDGALELAGQITTEFEEDWRAYTAAANVYSEAGDTDAALDALQSALDIAPDQVKPRIQQAIDSLAN